MRIIPFAALTPVPWANGGGITREIAAERDGQDILWRVSLAEVEAEGPFSDYPGLTRILTVVRGAGMELVTPEGTLLAEPLLPVRFPGALPVRGRLPGGPIRDLNVMLRDSRYRGEVARLGALPEGDSLRMLHVVTGSLSAGAAVAEAGATVIAPEGPLVPSPAADILDIRIIPAR